VWTRRGERNCVRNQQVTSPSNLLHELEVVGKSPPIGSSDGNFFTPTSLMPDPIEDIPGQLDNRILVALNGV
jgi:hypothetical protein